SLLIDGFLFSLFRISQFCSESGIRSLLCKFLLLSPATPTIPGTGNKVGKRLNCDTAQSILYFLTYPSRASPRTISILNDLWCLVPSS
ncbi:hypothetical protein MCOR06_006167, partial [Pyricularia oryzae]